MDAEISASRDEVTKFYEDYEKTITRAEDRELFDKMKSYRPEYLRLARSVRTEKPDNLTCGNFKQKCIHGSLRAEPFSKVMKRDHVSGRAGIGLA